MTDTAELIARLKREADQCDFGQPVLANLLGHAADALSSLVRERDEALKVLRDHHKWHAESGVLGIPDGDGGWIEMDNGAEYADSRLCQRTEAAISGMSPEVVVPPRGGWSMGSNHWENWQLAYRQKRAAEARATVAEAERDEALGVLAGVDALGKKMLAKSEADNVRLRATINTLHVHLMDISSFTPTSNSAVPLMDQIVQHARAKVIDMVKVACASLSNTSEGGKDD